MNDVSIIIVNYNVKEHVEACIESIFKSNTSKHNIEIFFVDNNSIDGSVEHISNKFPEIKIISNDKNIGFSKANNIALKQIKGEYVLILNPDTILEEGTFQKLISFCKSQNNIGAVTSKLIKANGKLDSACKRSFPTLSVALPKMFGLSKLFPKSKLFGKYNLTYLDENKIHEVDAICGAFMFIPKKVLDKVGLFDEDYFMYGEDLDLCFRIKKNGYKIFYYPEVTTIHLKGESTRKTHLSYVNNFYGAMRIFVKKNISNGSGFLSVVLQLGIFYRSVFSYMKRILLILIFPLLDAFFLLIAFIFSVKTRFNIFPNIQYFFIISVYVSIFLFLFLAFGAYIKKYRYSLGKAFNAIIAGFLINSSVTYFLKQYAYSREVIITSTIVAIFILLGYRGLFNLYRFFVTKNIMMNKINLLIVGDSKLNQGIEDRLISRYNVMFFEKLNGERSLTNLQEIIQIKDINEVVFAGDYFSNQDILKVMWSLKDKNVTFKVVPSGNDIILSKLHSNIYDLSLIEIEYNINNKMNIFFKRMFDIAFSLLFLIIVYPFVYLYNKVLKAELSKQTSKILLIPKVLTGSFSFVGLPAWWESEGKEYLGKKGLTGLVQLNHFEGMNSEEMMNYIVYYAKNQTLLLDIEILLKTIFSFIRRKRI